MSYKSVKFVNQTYCGIHSSIPTWAKTILGGRSALHIDEKSWQAFPFIKTGNKMFMVIILDVNIYSFIQFIVFVGYIIWLFCE